ACANPYSWIMRGYTQDKDAYLKRLRRIEGQVRGLQRMVESDTYCIDVLTQVSAVTRALQAVALGLVEDHLGHCVTQAIEAGGPDADAKVKEASKPSPALSDPEDWRRWVVYQIYPRSFADSGGDGVGALRGIIGHVGYLHRLGVDVVWLSPVYRSPMDPGWPSTPTTPRSTRPPRSASRARSSSTTAA